MAKFYSVAFLLLVFISICEDSFGSQESYRSAILDSRTRSSFEIELGKDCVTGVVELYAVNKDLSSKYVQAMSKSILDYSKKLSKGYPVYHYTNSNFLFSQFKPDIAERSEVHQQLSNAKNGFKYEDLLIYNRKAALRGSTITMDGWTNMENTVLYVASNPYSSSNYGKNVITFWMNDQTRVFPFDKVRTNNFDKIIDQDPKFSKFLKKCKSGINLAIIEESGIDLVDYNSGNSPEAGWFYLISTKNIHLSDVLGMERASSNSKEDFDKDVIRINDDLTKQGRSEEISYRP